MRIGDPPLASHAATPPMFELIRNNLFALAIPLGLMAAVLTGCFGGTLGADCGGESDCEIGLRCFTPSGTDAGLCTVRCEDDGSCTDGICAETSSGPLCLPACEAGGCDGASRCREPVGGGTSVCFVDDPRFELVPGESPPVQGPGRLELAGWLVEGDSNGDGALSAGEYATVHLYVQNPGEDPVDRAWAAPSLRNPAAAEIRACDAIVSSTCFDRDPMGCSCEQNAFDQYLDVPEGALIDDQPIVSIDLEISRDAVDALTFDVSLASDMGTWADSVSVPLAPSGARLEARDPVVALDGNRDGIVNPGEYVEIDLPAFNSGVTPALDTWAAVDVSDTPLLVDSCAAQGSSRCVERDLDGCDCAQNAFNVYPVVEAGTELESLLEVALDVPRGLVPGPIAIPVVFFDGLGGRWDDEIVVIVEATAAALEVATTIPSTVSQSTSTEVALSIANVGTSDALGVWAGVALPPDSGFRLRLCDAVGSSSCVDETADACDCEQNSFNVYPDIEAGSTVENVLSFTLEPLVTPSGPLSLAVTIGDTHGNRWNQSLTLQVSP